MSFCTKSNKHVPQKKLCDHTTELFLTQKKRPLRASLGLSAVCRDWLSGSEKSCSGMNHRSAKMIAHTGNILERNQRINFPLSVTRTHLIRVGFVLHYCLNCTSTWSHLLGRGAPSCGRETSASAVIAEPLKESDDIDEFEVSNVDGACPLHHCDSLGGSENTRCNTYRGQPCLRKTYCRHVGRGFLCVILCGEAKT